MDLENEELKQKIKILEEENARLRGELEVTKVDESIASTPTHQMVAPAAQMMDRVGVMEHSGVNPRSQVDVTELCSVKSTGYEIENSQCDFVLRISEADSEKNDFIFYFIEYKSNIRL